MILGVPNLRITPDDCDNFFQNYFVKNPLFAIHLDHGLSFIRNVLINGALYTERKGEMNSWLIWPNRMVENLLSEEFPVSNNRGNPGNYNKRNENTIFDLLCRIVSYTVPKEVSLFIEPLLESLYPGKSGVDNYDSSHKEKASSASALTWKLLLLSKLFSNLSVQDTASDLFNFHENSMCAVTGKWPIVGQRYFSVDSGINISENGWKMTDILSTKYKNDTFLKFYAPLLLPIINSEKDIHNLEVPNFQKTLKFQEFKGDFRQGRSIHTGVFCTSEFKCPYKNKAISGIRYMSLLDTHCNLCEQCEARYTSKSNNSLQNEIFVVLQRPLSKGFDYPVLDINLEDLAIILHNPRHYYEDTNAFLGEFSNNKILISSTLLSLGFKLLSYPFTTN